MDAVQVGVGLRPTHYPYLRERPRAGVDWFEAISENYMDSHGRPRTMLEFIRKDYPVALHGVSLSIGSGEKPNSLYLTRLKTLIDEINPFLVSDHLCWTGIPNRNIHDLLPLPFTEEALSHVVNKIELVQSFFRRQILIENVSSYFVYKSSEMSEWEFLREVGRRSGCGILLDINNIYVSAQNHGFDPITYIDSLSETSVGQMHLAGYSDMGNFLFDTHSQPVHEPVWELYKFAVRKFPKVPVLIEWDEDIPEFPVLEREALRARNIWHESHDA